MRFLYLLSFGLTAFAMPQLAAAQTLTIDPGLYDVSTNVYVGAGELTADETVYCVVEGENSKSFDDLVAGIAGDGQCLFSDVSMTGTTGTANFACTDTALGFDVSGTMEAKYGSDFYDIDTRAVIPIMGEVLVKTKVRRRGECPVN